MDCGNYPGCANREAFATAMRAREREPCVCGWYSAMSASLEVALLGTRHACTSATPGAASEWASMYCTDCGSPVRVVGIVNGGGRRFLCLALHFCRLGKPCCFRPPRSDF